MLLDLSRTCLIWTSCLRSPAPRVQNTKPLWSPKCTPKYTPNPLPKPKYEKITKNIRKSGVIICFSWFFRILVSGEDSGCISGCILGIRGVLYSARGAGDRNLMLYVGITLVCNGAYFSLWGPKSKNQKIKKWVHLEMKNLGHSDRKILNKHLEGANSELNSRYFPRKTPWIQKNGRI